MPRRSLTRSGNPVPHPRYGSAPIASGLKIPEDEIRRGLWRHGRDELFPETVLRANTDKQNFAVFPRQYYVDVLRTCRTCHRPFIFFAREQRYWFETLRFFVDADCVLCPVCRRDSRTVQRRLRRYSDLLPKANPTSKDLMLLVDDAAFLLEHGALRNLSSVGALKNRALRVIPEYPGLEQLKKILAASREARSAASQETHPR
ncbi:MAG: hypothetical protein F9K47_07635 [Burkholderiales bacterium]|nr:MAG: hypothetical protein F9K47_07635 [Burkholderiales bacterium]